MFDRFNNPLGVISFRFVLSYEMINARILQIHFHVSIRKFGPFVRPEGFRLPPIRTLLSWISLLPSPLRLQGSTPQITREDVDHHENVLDTVVIFRNITHVH